MPTPQKSVPVAALLLTLPVALSLACAPVAAATTEERCVELAQRQDEAAADYDKNPTESKFLHLSLVTATYQTHCIGGVRCPHCPPLAAQTAQPDRTAQSSRPLTRPRG
jgi:hypothetical protein